MPKEFETQKVSKTQIQSGIPMRPRQHAPANARGVQIRGVVVATYVVDDPDHPQADNQPVAVYCDVLAYSTISGMQQRLIKFALVKQERSGLHSGRVWKPRAATLDVTGNPLNLEAGTNPGSVDGDHVLVGFMDDSFNLPVIMGGIPHPSADVGNEQKDSGHRLRITVADGDPDFQKHHGAFYGVSDDGDFVVDTTDAYAGQDFEDDGKEKDPAEDGATGNHVYRLPKGSKLTVDIEGGPNLELAMKEGDATLVLGDGAVHPAIAEELKLLWDALKSGIDILDGHIHTTTATVGATAVVGIISPTTTPAAIPGWDTAVQSTKVSFPDG